MTYKSKSWVNGTRVHEIFLVPGPFCDIEDLEDTQFFYEYALPDFFTPDTGTFLMVMKAMNLFWEKATGKIINLVT